MKKIFTKAFAVFLCVVLTLTAVPLSGFVGLDLSSLFDFKAEAATYSGTCGDNLTWTLDTSTGLLEITGTGAMHNGLDSEDYPWWIHGSSIKSVVIGDGITTISNYVFHYWYPNLTNVIIPDSVIVIDKWAFGSCVSLTTITIGNSVIGIGEEAFRDCNKLTDVYYNSTEENWEEISIDSGNDFLFDATIHFVDGGAKPGVANYTLLNDAKKSFEVLLIDDFTADSWAIAEQAYADACAVRDDLTVNEQYIIDELTAALTDAIDSLVANPLNEYEISGKCGPRAEWRFNPITGVLKITGSGVTNNWSNVNSVPWCDYVYDVRDVRIAKGIRRIGSYAFYGCENLTSISIPDSITVIGDYAFSGCKRLMNVQLGNNIESIGECAFEYCSLLRRIAFPNSLKSISGGVFLYCSSLVSISIPAGVTSLGDFYDINEDGCTIYFGGTEDNWYELFWDDLPDNITVKFLVNQPGYEFADYSKVEAALELVPEDLTKYSDESVSLVYYALNSVVYDLELFYQNEVDKFATEIEEAVTKLEYRHLCNYSELEAALEEYYNILVFSDNYTADTWNVVEQAFEVARTIPEDLYYDVDGENQMMIDAAARDLFDAIENLEQNQEKLTDKTALAATVVEAESYDPEEYTDDSWVAFLQALANAQIVLDEDNATQKMVDTAETNLRSAMLSLELKPEDDTLISGTCGDNLTWILYESGLLEITGTGEMYSYSYDVPPWDTYISFIKAVEICDGITIIGVGAFAYCNNLTNVTISESVKLISKYAFYKCESLTDVYYGSTEDAWCNKITIGSDNEPLISATIHYNYGKPSITPTNGAVVDNENGTIYGLDAGIDSLDSYTEFIFDGYEWSYDEGQYGFGTGTVATLKNGNEIIAEYTVVIFGDIDGNGWYDANDAFIVNLIASGLISADRLNEAERAAADCNHDGVINELDFDLLINASVLLEDVDQSATQSELVSNSVYIQYCSLIDQTAGEETNLAPVPDLDKASSDNVADSETEKTADEINFEVIFTTIFDFIKKIFTLVLSFIVK